MTRSYRYWTNLIVLLVAIFSGLENLVAVSARAGEPSPEPILWLETGIHLGRITAIGVDGANRYLVTGSGDKTIRVWELATGRPLQILHPPIGQGMEGEILGVAISPDSRIIAAGGWTGREWDQKVSIYLICSRSARMVV